MSLFQRTSFRTVVTHARPAQVRQPSNRAVRQDSDTCLGSWVRRVSTAALIAISNLQQSEPHQAIHNRRNAPWRSLTFQFLFLQSNAGNMRKDDEHGHTSKDHSFSGFSAVLTSALTADLA